MLSSDVRVIVCVCVCFVRDAYRQSNQRRMWFILRNIHQVIIDKELSERCAVTLKCCLFCNWFEEVDFAEVLTIQSFQIDFFFIQFSSSCNKTKGGCKINTQNAHQFTLQLYLSKVDFFTFIYKMHEKKHRIWSEFRWS